MVKSTAASGSSSTLATTTISTTSDQYKQIFIGPENSSKRSITYLFLTFFLSTTIRTLLFSHFVFGSYLVNNLAPLERENVKWGWILLVRVFDLSVGAFAWNKLGEGSVRKDGVLLTRISLYAFEYSYFLLSFQTILTILSTDLLSLLPSFSLLPLFLPHSPTSHPSLTTFERLDKNKELVVNVILAYTLSTVLGALMGFVAERVGGYEGFVEQVYEVLVPSILSADSLTTSEMMRHPLVTVPLLRSSPQLPLPMLSHLGHSFLLSLLAIPFCIVLPSTKFSALQLGGLVASLVGSISTILLWDILPISLLGSLGVSTFLAARAGTIISLTAFILEELRHTQHIEKVQLILVDENDQVLKVLEKEVVIEEEVLESGEGVLEIEGGTSEVVGEGGLRARRGNKVRL